MDERRRLNPRSEGPSISIDAEGFLLVDGRRVEASHPGFARGTDCLTSHPWHGAGDGTVEWDCGCFVAPTAKEA